MNCSSTLCKCKASCDAKRCFSCKIIYILFEQLFPVEDKIGQREVQRDKRACFSFHGGEKDIKKELNAIADVNWE